MGTSVGAIRVFEALHRVHVALGPGFFHQVYRRATMEELRYQELSFVYIKEMPIYYQIEKSANRV